MAYFNALYWLYMNIEKVYYLVDTIMRAML